MTQLPDELLASRPAARTPSPLAGEGWGEGAPLVSRILAVYAILALAWFAFPGGVVAWMDDHNRSGWLDAPRAFAGAVDTVSAAVGVKQVGEKLRARVSGWLEGDQD